MRLVRFEIDPDAADDDERPVWVNPNAVAAVTVTSRYDTVIKLVDGDVFRVSMPATEAVAALCGET